MQIVLVWEGRDRWFDWSSILTGGFKKKEEVKTGDW